MSERTARARIEKTNLTVFYKGAFLIELFPTRLRESAQGFCYDFGRGMEALFPFLVGHLSQTTMLANTICIFAIEAYLLFFAAAFALPATRSRVPHANA